MSYNATIEARDAQTGELKSIFVGEVFGVPGRYVIARHNFVSPGSGSNGRALDPETSDRELRLRFSRRGQVLFVVEDGCEGYINEMVGKLRRERKAEAVA